MSKESTEMKALMRSPKALMDFKMTGRKPKAVQPTSPLIILLESISPRDRLNIIGIRLSPKLGYQSGAQFHTAAQLLNWLKPNPWIVGTWPAESCRIKMFSQKLILKDLLNHATKNNL